MPLFSLTMYWHWSLKGRTNHGHKSTDHNGKNNQWHEWPAIVKSNFKDKVDFLSCDCVVKETVWNRSEQVDHVGHKYRCVLQGSGVIEMIRNLAKSL